MTHVEQMELRYLRLRAIERWMHQLQDEKSEIHADILRAMGISIGGIFTDRTGEYKVEYASVDFMDAHGPNDRAEVAVVRLKCAPKTKGGFHPTARKMRMAVDKGNAFIPGQGIQGPVLPLSVEEFASGAREAGRDQVYAETFELRCADINYPGLPDEVVESDLPICRFAFFRDPGDPSVGLQGWAGWALTSNQEGTYLADLLRRVA